MAGNDYTTQWANGDNIQTLWNKIKAGFVGGLWDQTGYTAAWKTQARANLDLAFSTFHDSFWAGRAKADEKGNNLLTTYAHSMAFNTINGATYLTLYDNSYNGSTPSAVSLSNIAVNQSSGLLRLDGSGKIPLAHIPDSIAGQLLYAGTVSSNGVCALTDNAKNKWGIQSLTITASNYSSYQGAYFIASADFDSTRNAYIYYDQSYSGDKTVLVGDWVVATSLGWVKVDNTDAVRTISGVRDSSISPAPGTKGDVVMTAQRVGALDLYLPNTTQNVQGKVAFEKDIWSLGGVGAYGISDLSMGGGGGGGLSGSILRDWANFNPNDETQILGSNLGIEAFQMSGAKMQFKRNGSWVDAFTLGQGNIPNLELTQINGTDDLRAIEALAGTSGLLKKTAANTWTLDTTAYITASANVASATQLQTSRTINGTAFDGTADITTTKWGTARIITIKDNDATNQQANTGIDGSADIILKLPSTIKATLTGKADTAGKLHSAVNIQIASSDGTGASTAVSFDGSAAVTLKLPSTIKAALTGNASSATKLETARTIWGKSFDGSANITGEMSGVTNINTLMYFGTGKIGIGVSSPTKALDVSGDIQATGNIQSTAGGVAAAGIADLSMGGGTGGSGTVTALKINTHTPISPDADTGVITLNILEGDSNGTIKVDGENVSVHGLGNLAFLSDYGLSDLTGATEVNKIETLASTGTPSGFLKRAAGGAWSFDTTSYLPLAGGTMSNTNLVTNLNADLLDGKHNGELTALNMKQESKPDQEFTYRVCPKTIDTDSVKFDRIKGKTLVWNQLKTAGSGGNSYITRSQAADGKFTYTLVSVSSSSAYMFESVKSNIASHKFLFLIYNYQSTSGQDVKIYHTTSYSDGSSTSYYTLSESKIYDAPSNASSMQLFIDFRNATTVNSTISAYINIIDLTLMFGAGHEPSTVAEFEKWYNGYHSYNACQRINNSAKAIECVGFNLWDEEWEAGSLDYNTGLPSTATNTLVTKNYIKVIPQLIYIYKSAY